MDGRQTSVKCSSQNRYFDRGQHFHGSWEAANLRSRAWAILHNYWPWSPEAVAANEGANCPAERLNERRYCDCWLENLLVATSIAGTKKMTPIYKNIKNFGKERNFVYLQTQYSGKFEQKNRLLCQKTGSRRANSPVSLGKLRMNFCSQHLRISVALMNTILPEKAVSVCVHGRLLFFRNASAPIYACLK